MTKERLEEIQGLAKDKTLYDAPTLVFAIRDCLAENDQLRIELAAAREINTERLATIDRLRAARTQALKHIKKALRSPASMGWSDLEDLIAAREALEQK